MKKIICILIAALLIGVCVPATAMPPVDGSFTLVAQNAQLALYANRENGEVALYVKDGSYTWYSNPVDKDSDARAMADMKDLLYSQLQISYKDASKNTLTVNSHASSTIKSSVDQGSVTFTYTFGNLGIVLSLKHTLEEDYLKTELLFDKTDDLGDIELMSAGVMPFFGAGGTQEDGYLFIPDGSGALIRFNNNRTSARDYEEDVYGSDPSLTRYSENSTKQRITLPVFGVKKGDHAFLAVIGQGQAAASVRASVSGRSTDYNTVFSKVKYKYEESLMTDRTDYVYQVVSGRTVYEPYEVRYYPLPVAQADYSGMARRYQQYLEEEKGLTRQSDAKQYLYLELLGGVIKDENILGVPVKSFVPMTTFSQAEEILEAVRERGMKDVIVKYDGWTKNGERGKLPTKIKYEKKLGGEKDFGELVTFVQENGIGLYPNADLLNLYKAGNGFSKFSDTAKSINQSAVYQFRYDLALKFSITDSRWQLLKPGSLPEVTDQFAQSYQKTGLASVALDSLGSLVYSDFRKENGSTRTQSMDKSIEALGTLQETADQILLANANAYALPYARHNIAVPYSSSKFDIADEEIPFVQMVLHGYTNHSLPFANFGRDETEILLQAVETGSNIAFSWFYEPNSELIETEYSYLYSGDYRNWLDTAERLYQKLNEVLPLIGDSRMLSHDRPMSGVSRVAYENGTVVYVNYNESDVAYDGLTIQGRGYSVQRGL